LERRMWEEPAISFKGRFPLDKRTTFGRGCLQANIHRV
jgi:hypothetical protein